MKKKDSLNITAKYIMAVAVVVLLISLGIVGVQTNNLSRVVQQRELEVSMLVNRTTILESTVSNLNESVRSRDQSIANLQGEVSVKREEIEAKAAQIQTLNIQVQSLNSELGTTQQNLSRTTQLLSVAQNYEDRVEKGINLQKAYLLLGDYEKTALVVVNITGILTPTTDQQLWQRGKAIYDWLGTHYSYCSDKGFCIGDGYCTQIQFFSPDELIYYGAQDVLCGDCDDKAQLFAGMMYASGVPHDKVKVECGIVPGGGHCWNSLYVNSSWYRIDPVCSPVGSTIGSYVLQTFGLSFVMPAIYPQNGYRKVDCFNSYQALDWYNPEGYHNY